MKAPLPSEAEESGDLSRLLRVAESPRRPARSGCLCVVAALIAACYAPAGALAVPGGSHGIDEAYFQLLQYEALGAMVVILCIACGAMYGFTARAQGKMQKWLLDQVFNKINELHERRTKIDEAHLFITERKGRLDQLYLCVDKTSDLVTALSNGKCLIPQTHPEIADQIIEMAMTAHELRTLDPITSIRDARRAELAGGTNLALEDNVELEVRNERTTLLNQTKEDLARFRLADGRLLSGAIDELRAWIARDQNRDAGMVNLVVKCILTANDGEFIRNLVNLRQRFKAHRIQAIEVMQKWCRGVQ